MKTAYKDEVYEVTEMIPQVKQMTKKVPYQVTETVMVPYEEIHCVMKQRVHKKLENVEHFTPHVT